jgi:hypothetical protein
VTRTTSSQPIINLNTTSAHQASAIVTTESGTPKWAFGTNLGTGDNSFNIYNYAASARYLTITSGGNVGIGNTGFSNTRVTITGADNTSSNFGLVVNNSSNSNLFSIRNDGAATFAGSLTTNGDTFTNGRFALPFGSVRTYSAVGNIVINVGNLETLTGNNWRQISLMIFCTGIGDGLEFGYQNVVFVRIRGLSSWNGIDVFDIVGGASISLSNNTTTGFRLTLNVNAAARGSAMVMLASGTSSGQLS